MRAVAVFFSIIIALYGSETVSSDANTTARITVSQEQNNSVTRELAVVDPSFKAASGTIHSHESNETNWFFYRDFVDNMDLFQAYWSHRIHVLFSNLDQKFYILYGEDVNRSLTQGIDEEGNVTLPANVKTDRDEQTYVMSTWYDEFFKDETYLDATNTSYIRIRGGHEFDKRGKSTWIRSITARVRLPKTAGRFQLFIGDEVKDDTAPAEQIDTADNQGVGVKYFLPSFFRHFNASASVGFSGATNPYIRAHVKYPFSFKSWLIRPMEQVMYSYKQEFQEWTKCYFDKKMSRREMVRFLLQRSTQTSVVGMHYLARISYLNTLKRGVGFNNYIAISGRTKDLEDPYENGTIPKEGVYNYTVGMVWKQRFLRDYLFYQLEPIVEFHEEYEYMVNYKFRVSLELYFGKI